MAKLEFEDEGIEITIKGDPDKVREYGSRLQGHKQAESGLNMQTLVDLAVKHPEILEGKSGDIKDIFEGVAEIAPLFGAGLGGIAGILPIVDIVEKFIKRRKNRKKSKKRIPEIILNVTSDELDESDGKGGIKYDYIQLAIVKWHERYGHKFHIGHSDITSAQKNIEIIMYREGMIHFRRVDGHNMSSGVAAKQVGVGYHVFAIEAKDGRYFSEKQDHASHGVSTKFFEEIKGRDIVAIVIGWTINGKIAGRSNVYKVK